MGLISDGNNYTVLTDIQGLEDHFGDMDFKVGTVTGLQPFKWISRSKGLLQKSWQKLLPSQESSFWNPWCDWSNHSRSASRIGSNCPKIDTIKIDVDKIKIVIGEGGETIDKIIAETGVKIDIDEEGNVSIYSSDQRCD